METLERSKKTTEKLAQLLSIPPPLAQKLITDKVTDSYHKFTNASGDDQANMVGEGVGDVLQIFVGSGEVKGLLQTVKIVKLADESIPVIKIIEEGAEASGLVEYAGKMGSTAANRLGQQMHKAYKAGDVLDGVRMKEFTLPSGKRIDFIDLENKIIYELKPNNPRAIKQGYKQLEMYKQEVESLYGKGFKTILETY